MPNFVVLDPGFLSTVQDLGRIGLQKYGVPVSGAMDNYSLRAGNRLLGNSEDDAALEVTVQGPVLRVVGETVIAVTGASFCLFKNGKRITMWETHHLRDGDEIIFGPVEHGARAYLCVAGGFDVPLVLGSRSTFWRGGFGGFQGRAIRAQDTLPVAELAERYHASVSNFVPKALQARLPAAITEVRVMLGPQDHLFPQDTVQTLLSEVYQVTAEADRMGFRLSGKSLAHRDKADTISDGIAPGSIQVPGNGLPMILLADRQTTGGYLKIATIIGADLSLVGQMQPGDKLRFVLSSYEEARQALQISEAALRLLPARVTQKRIFKIGVRGEGFLAEVSEYDAK